jgi:hypothetical protein
MAGIHVRSRILAEVKAHLMNLPTSGVNVFADPAEAVSDASLPGIVIEPSQEHTESLGDIGEPDAGYTQQRELTVNITAIAKSMAQRDQSATEIEEAILSSSIGVNRKLESTGFDSSADGNSRLWVCALTFEIRYLTNSKYPRHALR